MWLIQRLIYLAFHLSFDYILSWNSLQITATSLYVIALLIIYHRLSGEGGGRSQLYFHFLLFMLEKNGSYQKLFFGMIFPKNKIWKSISSYIFWDGLKLKVRSVLRSENIDFWKCPPDPKTIKIRFSDFKIRNFHFWDLNQNFVLSNLSFGP